MKEMPGTLVPQSRKPVDLSSWHCKQGYELCPEPILERYNGHPDGEGYQAKTLGMANMSLVQV